MKVLYLGSFRQAWSTETYIASALREIGHNVTTLEERTTRFADIVRACETNSFDLFLFAKGRFKETNGEFNGAAGQTIAALIATIRPHVGQVASWSFDLLAPDFCRERFQWAQAVAPACDVFAVTDGFTAPQLPNAVVVRQAIPPDLDHEADWPTEYAGDVLWLGSVYRERHELADNLRARFGGRFAIVSNAAPTVECMGAEGWQPGVNYLALPPSPAATTAALAEILAHGDREHLRSIQRAGYALAKTLTYSRRCGELLTYFDAARTPAALDRRLSL